MKIISLDEVGSTNNYAMQLIASTEVEEGTVILTFRQVAGRGQGKNVWETVPGMNLTFSLVLHPAFLHASSQFLLSQVLSLGLVDFLESKTAGVTIKWPNDLLIGNKKVAGILVENSIMGINIKTTVAGIGININQLEFPAHLPLAVSLAQVTGNLFSLNDSLVEIYDSIMWWYNKLKNGYLKNIEESYLGRLLRFEQWANYQRENRVFEARIKGVDGFGQLLLEQKDGKIKAYAFKEVETIF